MFNGSFEHLRAKAQGAGFSDEFLDACRFPEELIADAFRADTKKATALCLNILSGDDLQLCRAVAICREAVPYIRARCLGDPRDWVRAGAVTTQQSPKVLKAFKNNDPSPFVQRMARERLSTIKQERKLHAA